MKNIKIKICGIKSSKVLDFCNNLGIQYFGLVFYNKSPRNISINKAINLVNLSNKNKIIPVGVFYNYDFNELFKLIKLTNLKYIQLHGDENNDYILKLKEIINLSVIKSISLKTEKDLNKTKLYKNADYLLFDYKPKKNELPGGNAKKFNWLILKNKNIEKPWFISGGINKNNINELLENLNPYGIDISSGVEDKLGIKSERKIKEIFDIIYD